MAKKKGAVTVFLIIMLFCVVLLGGLFIDATRVLLAKRMIRNDLNSAARSALSYYDENMAGEYGLFAVNSSTAEEAFRHYFKTNLKLSQSDGFNILSMSVEDEDISVTLSDSLSDHDTMQDQMAEYAKYRAPVNASVGAVEKIKGLFGKSGASEKVFSAANSGKDARKALAKDATEFSNSARTILSTGVDTAANSAKKSIKNLIGSTGPVTDEALGFDKIEAQIAEAEKESAEIGEAVTTYEETLAEASKSLDEASIGSSEYYDEESEQWRTAEPEIEENAPAVAVEDDQLPSQVRAEKGAVDERISGTRSRFEKAKTDIRENAKEIRTLTTEIGELEAQKDTCNAAKTAAAQTLDKLKEVEREDRFAFIWGDSPNTALEKKVNAYRDLAAYLKTDKADARREELTARLQEMADDIEQTLKGMENPPETKYKEKIETAEAAKKVAEENLKATEALLKDAKENRDKLVKETEALYDTIADSSSETGRISTSTRLPNEIKENAASNMLSTVTNLATLFQNAVSEMKKTADRKDDATIEDFGLLPKLDDLWGLIDTLYGYGKGLASLVSNRDEAGDAYLMTDYVFSRFSFLTSQTGWAKRHFQVGEIEYILTGENSQVAAIVDVLKRIALLRMTINFTDYMITSAVPGLTARLIVSSGRAILQTAKDMGELIFTLDEDQSASCQLSPSLKKVRMTYSDHLYLSFLLSTFDPEERDNMMSRIQTMMDDTCQDQNWDRAKTLYTHIKGEATVKIDLIMLTLPMFEAVLPEDNPILRDGCFLVRESVELGY